LASELSIMSLEYPPQNTHRRGLVAEPCVKLKEYYGKDTNLYSK
jgi:hypothetical protein